MTALKDRIIRAAKLDVSLYEEEEADKGAMGQAMQVVVLSSVAAGIGSIGVGGIGGIVVGTLAALVGWYIWAYLTYFIGTKLLAEPQTKADHGELLRTIGFSSAPGMIREYLPCRSGLSHRLDYSNIDLCVFTFYRRWRYKTGIIFSVRNRGRQGK